MDDLQNNTLISELTELVMDQLRKAHPDTDQWSANSVIEEMLMWQVSLNAASAIVEVTEKHKGRVF